MGSVAKRQKGCCPVRGCPPVQFIKNKKQEKTPVFVTQYRSLKFLSKNFFRYLHFRKSVLI